jgi:hypothetical protein
VRLRERQGGREGDMETGGREGGREGDMETGGREGEGGRETGQYGEAARHMHAWH